VVEALERDLAARDISPTILVNNAAFGLSGRFLGQQATRLDETLRLYLLSLVSLSHAFARRMEAAGNGHILLVTSLAAYQPVPSMAAYAAARVLYSLSERRSTLNLPQRSMYGRVACSDGNCAFNIANYTPRKSLKPNMLPASVLAESGVKAMFARKPSVVVGKITNVSAFSTRFFSRHVAALLGCRRSSLNDIVRSR
jgi:uncharacterized protein